MAPSARPVILAVITGAHGLGGEVRLKLFGQGVDALRALGPLNDGALTLKAARADKGGAIARFAEIADRTAAERARGTEIWAHRDALPPLDDGEYYHADLIGLAVVTTAGIAVGHVTAVENYGASDIIDIQTANGKRHMVPMTKAAVTMWDRDKIVIDPAFAP